jgi:protein subunit release factor B
MRELVLSVTKKDLRIQKFRAGGNGGQNQNARDTGVRVVHPESGAVGTARDSRSQGQNLKAAFRRMADSPVFRAWLKSKTSIEVSQEVPTTRYTYKHPDISLEGRVKDRD